MATRPAGANQNLSAKAGRASSLNGWRPFESCSYFLLLPRAKRPPLSSAAQASGAGSWKRKERAGWKSGEGRGRDEGVEVGSQLANQTKSSTRARTTETL